MTSRSYQWKNPSGLAKAALIMLAVQIGVRTAHAIAFAVVGSAGNYYDQLDSPAFTPVQSLIWALDMAALLALLGGGIVTALWIFRVTANSRAMRPTSKYGPWGAVLWYFVPIANLFLPWLSLDETWEVSRTRGLGRKSGRILGWWWGAFLISSFVNNIMSNYSEFIPPVGWLVSDILLISSAALFIVIVRKLTRMQIDTYNASVFSETETERFTARDEFGLTPEHAYEPASRPLDS